MVLASTLIIDTCESFQRTEGNHSATWFSRFALSIGPMAGLLLYQLKGFPLVSLVAAACCVASMILILLIHFPFRVPINKFHIWSLDRFFLTTGWPLFVNLLLVTVAVGMLLSLRLEAQFYALMMVGFLLALLAQRFVFRDADLQSEVVTGLLLTGAAILIMISSPHSVLHSPLLGLGMGLIGSRFLLFFIKLSRHCQRGTSQSTFLLGWESGIALGIGLGIGIFSENTQQMLWVAFSLVTIALFVYIFYMHQWFVKHKNR
jgi:hypothetical protein